MKNTNLVVYSSLIISMLFWGVSFIFSEIVFQVYPPLTTVFLRLVIASIILLVIGVLSKRLQLLQKEDFKSMILLSFFEPFLYFIGENYGLKETSSTITSVLIATIPLFSLVVGMIFYNEKITKMNILGIFISVFGVFLVIVKDDFTFSISLKGILFLLLAVFAAVAYSVLVLQLTKKYNVFSLIMFQNTIGIFMFFPLVFIFDWNIFINATPSWDVIVALFALAMFCSSLAFMLFTYGIQHVGITRANSFSNIIPVITAIIAWLTLDEYLSLINIVGILLVVVGLFVSSIKFRQKFTHSELDDNFI